MLGFVVNMHTACAIVMLIAFIVTSLSFVSPSLSLFSLALSLPHSPPFFQPTLLGSDLLDMAASHMKVKEKDYFSLYTEGEG